MLYFAYDLFNKNIYQKVYIHHSIGLCGGFTLYYKFYGILSYIYVVMKLNIFLNSKYLNFCKRFSDKMFIVTFLSIRCKHYLLWL